MLVKGYFKMTLKEQISAYMKNLPETLFPNILKEKATVFLSGSCGWNIPEGKDDKADWDLHIILNNTDYDKYFIRDTVSATIDDKEHTPIVFGQIRNMDWLDQRVTQENLLYLWIYTHGLFVQDPLDVETKVSQCIDEFRKNLPEIIKKHYVTFATRSYDLKSCIKRDLCVSAGLHRGEAVKAALQVLCLLKGKPYPYNKWLPKYVFDCLYHNHERKKDLVDIFTDVLMIQDLQLLYSKTKELNKIMQEIVTSHISETDWVNRWWLYNEN